MKKLLTTYWPMLFLAGVLLVLFYKVFLFGQVFYEGDNFHLNIPAKYFLVEQISHGIFPFWNPYLFLGIPYFADFNVGALHPLNFLYFLFPVPRALTLVTILDFFFIGIFQYHFLRILKLQNIPALMGAVVFAFSGVPVNLFGNMTYLNVVVYMPLIFLLAYLLSQKKKLLWLFLLIIVQTIQFVSGHPQTTYYTMLFTCIFLFFFSNFTWKNRVFILATYLLFPLLLSAAQLIPFIEYVFHATRPIGNIDYASWGNLTLPGFIIFLFPLIFGNHVDGNWWGPQWILSGYIGISTLFIVVIGLWKTKFAMKRFVITGIFLSLLLAMGKLTPLFYIFYFLVPGWRFFRAPSGILIFYTFFMSIAAAYGMEFLTKKNVKLRRVGFLGLVCSFVLSLVTAITLIFSNKPHSWTNVVTFLVHKGHIHILSHLLLYTSTKIQSIFFVGLWNLFFFAILIFLTLSCFFEIKRRHILLIVLLVLTTISLIIPDSKVLTSTQLTLYSQNLPVPSVLHDVQNGHYRVLTLQIDLHQKRENLPGSDYFLREARGNIDMYKDDNNIERGIYQARGYTSLTPASYGEYLNSYDVIDVTGVDVTHMNQTQLNNASVKYIISHEPLFANIYNGIILTPVATSSGKYYIYENKDALPRLYIMEDPHGQHVTSFQPSANNIAATVTVNNPSHLILTDWYYPGWKAFVNGKQVPITVYSTTFRRIAIPKGTSEILFTYDPFSFKIGLILTLLSVISFGGLFIFLEKKDIH